MTLIQRSQLAHRGKHEFSLNSLAAALLRGVGLTTCLASLGAVTAGPAWAVDLGFAQVYKGADGKDGSTAFGWESATAGQKGPSSYWTQNSPLTRTLAGSTIPAPWPATGTITLRSMALEIGSVGGAGGSVYSKGVFHNVPGKPGGSAGDASLTVSKSADITWVLNYAVQPSDRSLPVISVYSVGGTGGLGFTSWTESDGGISRGGDGGEATLSLASRVTAVGGANPRNLSVPAIKVLSEGGAAGIGKVDGRKSSDGTYEHRVDIDRGGNGGRVNVTLEQSADINISGALAPALSASSLGGNGGNASNSGGYPSNAGDGGTVNFTNRGAISSNGNNSAAVILQSAGGAGGNGANGAFTSGTPGARGGTGGTVNAFNTGTISAKGDYSFGLVAQSVGGSGGSGGGAAFVSGGDGGGAGLGGKVSVFNRGGIATMGAGASAIMAQSIGGGSALDAFHAAKPAITGKGGGSGGNSGILPFSSGGTGGQGGVGGTVYVEHSGAISTTGDAAYGVLAQSIGGGGGTGGAASSSTAFLAVALGGAGGGGGIGGEVGFLGQAGRIETAGKNATAVLAQSVGGGGGTGGYATSRSVSPGLSASSATGGSGGKGGKGGYVKIYNLSNILTQGEGAVGLQATSIGGGGGSGGGASAFAVALPIVKPSGDPLPSITITNAIGGSGGDGGQGGPVNLDNKDAAIETYGVGATGIVAQSIGGGGGNAGNAFAYGLAIAAPGASAFNFSNSIGGSGGGGGNSEYASANNYGSVLTHGDGAVGMHVQSIGGGGGAAGAASASADALSLYRTVAFGQTIGGTNTKGGGKGGSASATNRGLIETRGTGSTGILLQSIGGGGGSGGAVQASASSGLSFDKTLDSLVQKLPLADAVTVVNAIGGNGGNGGDGGVVAAYLESSSLIRTRGAQADGVLAQSIGGGGGTGGGGSTASEGKTSITLSMGGTGGSGGSGDKVEITHAGKLETYGNASHGIFAQSIGGGGGNGGSLAAPDDAPDTVGEIWATLKNAVGADAYKKWAADKKNADTKEALDAFIKDIQNTDTYKSLADSFKKSDFYKEMQASGKKITDYLDKQSKGAVKRPDVSLTASLGGNGGAGNRGGIVKLTQTGTILTTGNLSHGMLAQSIGGGGGQGGVAYASGTNKTNLSATLGGKGGSGNIGGAVEVKNAGSIESYGEASYGMFAQSIGGGGGNGVGALSSDNKNLVLNFTAGGSGGQGSDGGSVKVFSDGTIRTHGAEAHAIVAQSIGAGGGAFMMSANTKADAPQASDTQAASAGTIKELLKAVGIEKIPAASTESGDKKPSSKSGSFTLGGSGGASGSGNTVQVVHGGTIATSGTAAFGILAQSIGGGGGISNAAGSPGGVKYAVSYGGNGGAAGHGGNVFVHFKGKASIQTSGDNSTAVFAQSIGGGGGYGGASVLQGWTLPVLGGSGGSSGNGGYIEIGGPGVSNVAIQTTGAKAHGIFAQSLGGGGGKISDALKTDGTVRAALEKTATVLNGIVTKVGASGKILDNIDKVPAEFQSIVRLFGNDQDTVNSALTKLKDSLNKRSASSGTGGEIRIYLKGDVKTTGAGSHAIFAQSGFQQIDGVLDPSRGGGDILVAYQGVLQGGSGEGTAIVVDGGRNNRIDIGTGSHVSSLSGRAVTSTFGEELLLNFGTLAGDIDLAYGSSTESNIFENAAQGTYISGDRGIINVGSSKNARFRNVGTFDIGGVGNIATATVKAADIQLGGTLRVDVNSVAPEGAPNADLLQATKITIDGLAVKPHAVDGLLPDGSFTVVSASTLETKGKAKSGASPASPISWSVSQSGNKLLISPTSADFIGKAPGTLTDTERSLLNSLQQAWDTSETGVAGLFADMANIDSAQMYSATINSLTATEDIGRAALGQTLTGRRSLNAAFSCPLFDGSGVTMRETQCVWSRIIGSRMTQKDGPEGDGFSQDRRSYRMGGQWEIRPDWFFGVTAAYNTSKMHTSDGLTSIDGDSGDVSFSVKHQTGPWLLGAALHAGYGSYDSNSLFMIGHDLWSASNTSEVWTAGLRLRAAYEITQGSWYIKPYADLDVLHTYMPGYTLTGDGATLTATSMKEWSVAFEPAIEAGTRVDLGKYGWLRPYVSAGVTFINNKALNSEVTFSENGGQGITFRSSSSLPDRLFNLGAGLQLFAQDKFEVRAEYKAQMAHNFRNHELSLRAAIPF